MEEMIVHFVGDPSELFRGETMKAELLLGGSDTAERRRRPFNQK